MLRPLGHDRDRIEQRSRGWAKARDPREHGVADRVGDSIRTRRERLDDEEGVAGGLLVELRRVDAAGLGELRDGLTREPREPKPAHQPARRKLSQNDPQPMLAVELVIAEARHNEGLQPLHSAGEHAQHVQRRLVRPVHVLEHEDGRTACCKLGGEQGCDLVGHRTALERRLQIAILGLRDPKQAAERTRRKQ